MCHSKNKQRFPKNIWKRFFWPCLETPFPSHFVLLFLGWDFLSLCENTISALDLVVASEISFAKVKLLVKVRVLQTNQSPGNNNTKHKKTHSFLS